MLHLICATSAERDGIFTQQKKKSNYNVKRTAIKGSGTFAKTDRQQVEWAVLFFVTELWQKSIVRSFLFFAIVATVTQEG